MTQKDNITAGDLGTWDKYSDLNLSNALKAMYEDAGRSAKAFTDWYWISIRTKRTTSLWIRGVTFALVVGGALLPLTAAVFPDERGRLLATQLGVVSLAFAGFLQLADKVFGWSSGWLRYVATVTAMEATTRQFQLDWTGYVVGKGIALGDADRKPLFDLAEGFVNKLAKLQADETDKWVADFNSGVASLNDAIKTQREATDKAVEVARQTAEARDKEKLPGAIELTIVHKAEPKPLTVSVDDGEAEAFLGTVWSRLNAPTGIHILKITCEASYSTATVSVLVNPGAISRVSLPAP
jgi:hypothetical protein